MRREREGTGERERETERERERDITFIFFGLLSPGFLYIWSAYELGAARNGRCEREGFGVLAMAILHCIST